MRQSFMAVLLALVAAALCVPSTAFAQTGTIAGQVRDASGLALPGVTVEVTSPALIEKVRVTESDGNGRYQIPALPVGTYTVTFKLSGFATTVRNDVQLTTDFVANVVADLKVGGIDERVTVVAEPPVVDVQNARQQLVFQGRDIRDLPTERNVPALLTLVPGITSSRGVCSGGAGVFCSPNLSDFNSHASALDSNAVTGQGAGLNQGRIMVDGMVINNPNVSSITGMTGGYNADIANAQEISFTLSGGLGETETGGATINIVPRTGGNRYSGNYFTSYTDQKWFDKNNRTRNSVTVVNTVLSDYDVSGSFGGPILRDKLWFFGVARVTGKEAFPQGGDFFWNRNLGIPGMNYQPDRSRGNLTYTNQYKNANVRLTYQPTQKNKFNVFWDEQDSCQDPCGGVVSVYTSPESWWSVQTWPNHLGQLTWQNPVTSRTLLEARISVVMQHYDLTKHREIANPRSIPRITESGDTAGGDEVATRVNPFAGLPGFALTSGSLNESIGGGGAVLRNTDSYRSAASASYITGSHNAKIGYEGGYFMEKNTNAANDLRLTLAMSTPASNCYNAANPSASSCGNTSLYFPDDPYNSARRPVPTSFTVNTGVGTLDERVWYGSLYVQDQWTLNRFTLNGALRYDHAESRYGVTCVGPDIYVPVQNGGKYDGQNRYCTEPTNGVNYDDITPRWGVTWDLFGNGKTAVKWNMGKYLAGASLGGLYTNVNPARRSSNSLNRGWQDTNGNRVPDCRVFDFTAHTDLGDTCNAITSGASSRYGRDPLALDANGLNPVTTVYCGQSLDRASAAARTYCEASGDNLVNGWGKRRYEWQLGLGVQHEVLPRVSAEVTYNRRLYGNQTVNDQLNVGCDKFGTESVRDCQQGYLDYTSPQYDFYSIQVPVDPRLPFGGGYVIQGLYDEKTLNPPSGDTVVTFAPDLNYGWHGVDTNMVLRARGGFRISGGTSTGRSVRDTCFSDLDTPNVKARVGNRPACQPVGQWTTNVRANMSYTIPWVDVLASGVFQYRPGGTNAATLSYNKNDIVWDAASAGRANVACTVQGQPTTGCFFNGTTTSATASVDLLDFGDLYGEGMRLWDLKFAKNIRFAGKRVNVGVDVYNVFNSDAAQGYTGTYTAFRQPDGTWGQDNPSTAAIESTNNWRRVSSLVNPRFARFQVQFEF